MPQAEHISIAGVVIALLFAAYGFYRYHGGGSRLDLLLSLLIALGVALVSVVPQFFEIVTGLAVKEYAERYLSSEERVEGHPDEVLIIVPAYDEEGGIQDVLRRIPDEVLGHKVKTVVVDDGSADRTADVARAEGVPVVSHVVNRGQGDALRTGFAIAQAEKSQIVINLDADGQYKPEEMDRLVKPIIEGRADFVLGSRFMGYYQEAGSVRHVGVVFFSRMISLLTGVKVSDCTNGYRAI